MSWIFEWLESSYSTVYENPNQSRSHTALYWKYLSNGCRSAERSKMRISISYITLRRYSTVLYADIREACITVLKIPVISDGVPFHERTVGMQTILCYLIYHMYKCGYTVFCMRSYLLLDLQLCLTVPLPVFNAGAFYFSVLSSYSIQWVEVQYNLLHLGRIYFIDQRVSQKETER